MPIIVLIATILLPPLGVALKHGLDKDFIITLILTILGYLPGIVYGIYANYLR